MGRSSNSICPLAALLGLRPCIVVELRKALAVVSCHQEDYALAPPQGMAADLEDSTIPVTKKVG